MRQYSNEDEVLTADEYEREVVGRRCPPLIERVRRVLRDAGPEYVEATGDLEIRDIRVERVTSMRERDYWKVKFSSGLLDFEFSAFDGVDIETPGRNRSFEIVNKVGETKVRFNFDARGRIESVKSAREDGMRSGIKFDGNNPFTPKQPKPPKVHFGIGGPGASWRCECVAPNWCIHIQDYWDAGRDAGDLMKLIKDMRNKPKTLKYWVPGGFHSFELLVTPVEPQTLGLPETDPKMYRLSFGEHLSMWVEDDMSPSVMVRQLLEMVELSPNYRAWLQRGMNGMTPEEKCRNRYHNKKDSKAFMDTTDTLSRDLQGGPRAAQWIFANAFTDYYVGRCIPCVAVLNEIQNEGIPSGITGPATRNNPF